jgi:hypothetical protein
MVWAARAFIAKIDLSPCCLWRAAVAFAEGALKTGVQPVALDAHSRKILDCDQGRRGEPQRLFAKSTGL